MPGQGFTCKTCGQFHEGIPLAWGPDAPASWEEVPVALRASRGRLTSDTCVLDDRFYFVRGCLDIPIRGASEVFRWLVWVSVTKPHLRQVAGLWARLSGRRYPPIFGWLNSFLPYEPPTLNLKSNLHWRGRGIRPFVELEPTSHPLAEEQREGIHWERAYELAGALLHGAQKRGA